MAVVLQALRQPHTATIIFLHGLGDSGHGWSEVGRMLQPHLPHVKWIFPHAPSMPVTWNGGAVMPAWYDIRGNDLMDDGGKRDEDASGLERSRESILAMLRGETDAGLPSERIVLGGFSQGGAVTLHTLVGTGASPAPKLAGAAVLSSYLPLADKFKATTTALPPSLDTPVFMAHGTADQVVPFERGASSAELVRAHRLPRLEFHRYTGMGHSSCDEELRDLLSFLKRVVPAE